MEPVFLEGERVFLSAVDPDGDLGEYASWVDDAETTRYMGSGRFPFSVDEVRGYVRTMRDSKTGLLLGIHDKTTSKHVGNVTLHMIDWVHRKGEIGILVGDREARGRGLGAEAVALVVRHGFERLGLNRISAGYVDGNEGSKRLFESLGFSVEGCLAEDFFLDGAFRDTYRVALLRSAWQHGRD